MQFTNHRIHSGKQSSSEINIFGNRQELSAPVVDRLIVSQDVVSNGEQLFEGNKGLRGIIELRSTELSREISPLVLSVLLPRGIEQFFRIIKSVVLPIDERLQRERREDDGCAHQ